MSELLSFAADPNNTCVTGSLRLSGGSSPSEGRLEVCYDDHWGTVCDDDFGNTNAGMVCRLLGYPLKGTDHAWDFFNSQSCMQKFC